MNNKISIIIPFYNTKEEYLEQSIKSAINQTYKNIEIIIINDGSDEKYEEYLKKYENVKIINIINSGVSVARNLGIINSTGDYLMFLDSDDYLMPNACEIVNKIINKDKNIDIIITKTKIHSDKSVKENYSFYNKDIERVDKKEIIESIFNSNSKFSCVDTPWAKVYKRKFLINYNIKFNDRLKNGEDGIFNFEAFYKANQIYFTPQIIHNYRVNEFSTCSTYFPDSDKRFSDLLLAYKKMFEDEKYLSYDKQLNLFSLRIFCRLLRKYYSKCNSYNEFICKMESNSNIIYQENINKIKYYECKFPQKIILVLYKTEMYLPLYLISKSKLKIK